jgi:hypothetical protein
LFDLNQSIESRSDYLLVANDELPPICPVECPKPEKYGAGGVLGIATAGDGVTLVLPTRGGLPPICPVECPKPENTGVEGGVRAVMYLPKKLEKTRAGEGLSGEGAEGAAETKVCPMGDELLPLVCAVACPKPEKPSTAPLLREELGAAAGAAAPCELAMAWSNPENPGMPLVPTAATTGRVLGVYPERACPLRSLFHYQRSLVNIIIVIGNNRDDDIN